MYGNNSRIKILRYQTLLIETCIFIQQYSWYWQNGNCFTFTYSNSIFPAKLTPHNFFIYSTNLNKQSHNSGIIFRCDIITYKYFDIIYLLK